MYRLRSRAEWFPTSGYCEKMANGVITVHQQSPTSQSWLESCEDHVNERFSDNPFSKSRDDRRALHPLNGNDAFAPGFYRLYVDYYPTAFTSGTANHCFTPAVNLTELATKVLARSNPSRPYVSVPTFIYELKDLPGMMKEIGELKLGLKSFKHLKGLLTPRQIANHTLSVEMGWQPFFSDIKRMLDFQGHVDARVEELKKLYAKGGLHRTVGSKPGRGELYSECKEVVTTNVVIDSTLGNLVKSRKRHYSEFHYWGTTRWLPTTPKPHYTDREMAQLARHLLLGTAKGSIKQLWDAIPWTWMTDWFLNVGDLLQATNNIIPATASPPCIMEHAVSQISWTRENDGLPMYSGGDGLQIYETKKRFIVPANLTATVPFIGKRPLSILSALAVQRSR